MQSFTSIAIWLAIHTSLPLLLLLKLVMTKISWTLDKIFTFYEYHVYFLISVFIYKIICFNFQNGDDRESLEELAALQALPCPLANITSIECRDALTQEPSESSNPAIKCDLENMGLQCRQTYKGERCKDYEIRVYCHCHEEGKFISIHLTSVAVVTSIQLNIFLCIIKELFIKSIWLKKFTKM